MLAALIIFYPEFTSIIDTIDSDTLGKLVQSMYDFFNCGSSNQLGTKSNHKLIDWKQDEQLICSAINKVANKEVRAEKYVHWWTFMGFYTAIGESPIATIISIRDKIVKNKRLEKHEREYRQNNPQYFVWNSNTVEKNEADQLLKEMWNSNE